jgi:hypothetical protein
MSLSQPVSTSVEHTDSRSEIIQQVADRVQRAGMGGPVAIFLHTFKPLAWVGGQLAWVLQPFADALNPGERTSDSAISLSGVARLLENEKGVEELLEKLRTPGGRQ